MLFLDSMFFTTMLIGAIVQPTEQGDGFAKSLLPRALVTTGTCEMYGDGCPECRQNEGRCGAAYTRRGDPGTILCKKIGFNMSDGNVKSAIAKPGCERGASGCECVYRA
jgi:hypothetical protein